MCWNETLAAHLGLISACSATNVLDRQCPPTILQTSLDYRSVPPSMLTWKLSRCAWRTRDIWRRYNKRSCSPADFRSISGLTWSPMTLRIYTVPCAWLGLMNAVIHQRPSRYQHHPVGPLDAFWLDNQGVLCHQQ